MQSLMSACLQMLPVTKKCHMVRLQCCRMVGTHCGRAVWPHSVPQLHSNQ